MIFLNVYIVERTKRNHGGMTAWPKKKVKLCSRVGHSFLCRSSRMSSDMNLVISTGGGEIWWLQCLVRKDGSTRLEPMRVGEIWLIPPNHCILQACFKTPILFQLCLCTSHFLKKFYFILKYCWFTMLCYFQVYSQVIHLYIYIYPFFLRFFSHIGYYKLLSRLPCAIK